MKDDVLIAARIALGWRFPSNLVPEFRVERGMSFPEMIGKATRLASRHARN